MNRNSNLYKTINYIVNMDISFILNDIIGPFAEPDFPVNMDRNNFEIDIETPHGNMHISLISQNNGEHCELILKRIISNTFCEEYKVHLGRYDENFLCLDGKTVDLRSKGFVVNYIEKKYDSSSLSADGEENRQIYESGKIAVDSIASITKVQETYSNKQLQKVYGKKIHNNEEIFDKLDSIKLDISLKNIYPQYVNTVSMNLPVEIPNNTNTIFINVKINGHDRSWVYPMILGSNAVGRAFKLYLGIVEQSNYDDAIKLINAEKFNMGFAYEDYEDGVESVNKIIEDLAGSPTVSYQREYSIEVRNIVNKYYNHVKNNPFLFDEYAQASSDKKRQLEKNAYIKQILLSNRD